MFGPTGESDALGLGNGSGEWSYVHKRGGAGGGRRRGAGGRAANDRNLLDDAAFGYRRRCQQSSRRGDDDSGPGDRARKGAERHEGARPADAEHRLQTITGNDLQPDVYFRGFDASPVYGTPQGLAVYQNGVRINEAFGDTVNWDLIPTLAVRSIDVISNNPAFGLNALGGALAVQMKDGFNFQGTTLDLMGGSFGRAQGSLQWGKQVGPWAAYIAIDGAHDDGYREFGGSDLRRIYGDIGYKAEQGEFHISAGGASNIFGAAATSPFELLQAGWGNVYTTPQTSLNQVGYVNANANVDVTPTWSMQANAHVRSFYQSTQDGNPTDVQSCDPAQGGAAGFLCFNDPATPAFDINGNQLADNFTAGATLGEIDRTHTQTTTVGATLQATNTDKLFGHNNHFVFGASFDYGVTHFGSSAELELSFRTTRSRAPAL